MQTYKTELDARAAMVNFQQSWVAKKVYQGDANHRYIIDRYNTQAIPLPRGYKVKYTDAWCQTFQSFAAIELFMTSIIPLECGCGEAIKIWQKLGCWMENDAYIPQSGDIVYYDWDDNANTFPTTDNTGWPEHVGMVASVNGNKMLIIEGNKSKSVSTRELQINGRYIRGYGLPAYHTLVKADPAPVEPSKPVGTGNNPGEAYKEATKWAIDNGLFRGDGNGNYNWQGYITREQFAQVLYNSRGK